MRKLDLIGTLLSVGCLIHCLLLPLVLPLLPLIGLTFDHESWFHLGLSGVIALIALGAFIPGYKKHKEIGPSLLGVTGIYSLFGGGVLESVNYSPGIIFTILGGVCMIIAHYLNHKLLCSCEHHGDKKCH